MAPRVSRQVAKATAISDGKSDGKRVPRTAFKPGPDPRRGVGKKGRSGRKPNEFKALVREIVSSAATLEAAEAILNNPKHPAWAQAFKALTPYAYGQPTQHVAVSGTLDLTSAANAARAKLAKLAGVPKPDAA